MTNVTMIQENALQLALMLRRSCAMSLSLLISPTSWETEREPGGCAGLQLCSRRVPAPFFSSKHIGSGNVPQ